MVKEPAERMELERIIELEQIAKISLTPEERKTAQGVLQKYLEDFTALTTDPRPDVTPLVRVPETENELREDAAIKMVSRERLLANSPEQSRGYFQVPRTLE